LNWEIQRRENGESIMKFLISCLIALTILRFLPEQIWKKNANPDPNDPKVWKKKYIYILIVDFVLVALNLKVLSKLYWFPEKSGPIFFFCYSAFVLIFLNVTSLIVYFSKNRDLCTVFIILFTCFVLVITIFGTIVFGIMANTPGL
jgi:hypothetical protein